MTHNKKIEMSPKAVAILFDLSELKWDSRNFLSFVRKLNKAIKHKRNKIMNNKIISLLIEFPDILAFFISPRMLIVAKNEIIPSTNNRANQA